MFRFLTLAILTGALFLVNAATYVIGAEPTTSRARPATISSNDSGPIVADDGPGLGGGY